MANQIILDTQIFKMKDFNDQFPGDDLKKKIIFQAELQSLVNGDAKFGIIAYPAWQIDCGWIVGTRVEGAQTTPGSTMNFQGSLGFANNELVVADTKNRKSKKRKGGKKKKEAKKNRKFQKLFRKVSCDPKRCGEALLHCKTSISSNPHLEYEVTLESGGVFERLRTNPSPPDNPAY